MLFDTIVADWSVTIWGVYGQSIDFDTGTSTGATIQIELFDVCRTESSVRTSLGTVYPFASTVVGIDEDHSGIISDPGTGNKISYAFNAAINETSYYYPNIDNTLASIIFCVQIALYDGGTMVNFAEAKVDYTMDLSTSQVTLASSTITSAAGYTDATDTSLSFDGTIEAYFCNPDTFTILPYTELSTTQGSIISVCIRVPNGQYEIKNVESLTIQDYSDGSPSQTIVTNSDVVDSTMSEKTCYDTGNTDTNVCVIKTILRADFYETSSMTLDGSGSVLLELGDSSGTRRRMLRRSTTTTMNDATLSLLPRNSDDDDDDDDDDSSNSSSNRILEQTVEGYKVDPAPFTMISADTSDDDNNSNSNNNDDDESPTYTKKNSTIASIVTGCVIALFLLVAFVYCWFTGRLDDKNV